MGRYRPPAEKSTPLISAAGLQALKQELEDFWPRRREVTAALTAAAAEGDRSENAEYIYRKKQLREMDRRIGYLQRRIPTLKVVANKPSNCDQVFFAACVRLLRLDGEELEFTIVGPDEIGKNRISIDSPLARGCLKKEVGDEVEVETPAGVQSYEVMEISYRE